MTDKAKPGELGSTSTSSLTDNISTSQNSDTPSSKPSQLSADIPAATLPDRAAYDKAMWQAIYGELGYAEPRPAKVPLNPFLFYQKDFWQKAREQCDADRQTATKNPNAKAARDEIRVALGHMWRKATDEEKLPYLETVKRNREDNEEALNRWPEFAVSISFTNCQPELKLVIVFCALTCIE